jgi:hypothetical protein
LAFIRAFEIVAAYLELAPTISLFFHLFGIQRSHPRGNVTDKCRWVSLKQHKKFFDIFEESLWGFKDAWFVVRPMTSEGWKTILVRGPKIDDDGNVVLGDNGQPIEVDCECDTLICLTCFMCVFSSIFTLCRLIIKLFSRK